MDHQENSNSAHPLPYVGGQCSVVKRSKKWGVGCLSRDRKWSMTHRSYNVGKRPSPAVPTSDSAGLWCTISKSNRARKNVVVPTKVENDPLTCDSLTLRGRPCKNKVKVKGEKCHCHREPVAIGDKETCCICLNAMDSSKRR